MDKQTEIRELEYAITTLDTLYEQGDDCIHPLTGRVVSDPEYDAMRARLASLAPKSPVLKDVTASQVSNVVKKVMHKPPMTSISKAIGTLQERTDEFEKWKKNVLDELRYKTPVEKWCVQAYKLDGVALALYYEKGKLVAAGLRPRDGVAGEDVTENAKYVDGIQETLPIPLTGTIRGEIICKKSVFEQINAELAKKGEKTYANPRNFAAGSIRQFKDPKITKERKLSFVAYIIISDDVDEMDEIERAKWCNKELGIPYVRTMAYGHKDKAGLVWDMAQMEKYAPDLDYEVDGVVLSVRNIEDREQLGTHGNSPTGNPKGRLAWKFEEEHVDVAVDTIEWNTGRTGAIVPVLGFKPVQLAGTTVRQCTGHNVGFLTRNKVAVGTVIRVIKSGKIIPKVAGVISNLNDPKIPDKCASCGHSATVVAGNDPGMSELMCSNRWCSARAVRSFCHYLTTLGVKGVAESTMQKLYDASLVGSVAELYELKPKQLADIGLGDRNSRLAIARIHMINQPEKLDDDDLDDEIVKAVKQKKKVPLWQFFAALGIDGAGKSAGRALTDHFGDFNGIMNATEAELSKVEDIGPKTAKVIADFFKNKKSIQRLLNYVELELPKVGKLTGKTFCFTGGFPEGKSKWQKEVEDLGGKVASSVSARVDFVVVGQDAGSKADKADELQIKKLTLDQLKKML